MSANRAAANDEHRRIRGARREPQDTVVSRLYRAARILRERGDEHDVDAQLHVLSGMLNPPKLTEHRTKARDCYDLAKFIADEVVPIFKGDTGAAEPQ